MKTKAKTFILGFIIGGLLAFPLGMNFGRDEPLLSNPFADRAVTARVKRAVKDKTGRLMDKTKETIHDATRPVREQTNQ